MTRLLLGAAIGFTIGVVGAAALGIHAQDADGTTYPTWHEGELSAPVSASSQADVTPVQPTGAASVSWPWTALAACESTGRWNANTGNGYYGGLQQDMTFWRNHGGLAYAPRPDLASPAHQVAVAERGLKVQGWLAWPACSRRLGLR